MPTVYLPLLSAEAHGAFGDVIIYQGQKCRIYKVPHDPRTEAQTDVRKMFYDVTKMETFCGAWAKAAWKTAFGSRWYTSLYKRVTENGSERFNAADAVWDGYTQGQKDAWNAAAPFQVTYNAPGTVFHALMVVMSDWLAELGAPDYDFPGIDPDGAEAAGAWAAKTLENVLTSGDYEDDNTELVYSGDWTEETDINASGGKYHKSGAATDSSVGFYFYGTRITIKYSKGSGNGIAHINSFALGAIAVEQNAEVVSYGEEWISPGIPKGLHYLTVSRSGTGNINIDGIGVSAARIQSTQETAVYQAEYRLPGALTEYSADVVLPQTSPSSAVVLVNYPFYFDTVLYDKGEMLDPVNYPGRFTCKVDGVYMVNLSVRTRQFVYMDDGIRVKKNGATIASVKLQSVLNQQYYMYQITKLVKLNVGDYLTVDMDYSKGPSSYGEITKEQTWFEVQLFSRTDLRVNTLVTEYNANHHEMQNLNTYDDHPQYFNQARGDARYPLIEHGHDHGDLTGLADDDHSQYYNQARGDARYSLLSHIHTAGKYGIPLYTHLGSVGVPGPAGTVRYAYPPHTVYFSGIGGVNIPGTGTMKNLFVRLSSAQPGTGSLVITVQKNLVGTGLSVTIPAGSGGGQTFTNLVNTVAWNSGDILTWHIQNNAGTTSGGIGALAVELEKTTT